MAKQTQPIHKTCQHKSVCLHDATIGVYGWRPGATDVDLNHPLLVLCGRHKMPIPRNVSLRNVRLDLTL